MLLTQVVVTLSMGKRERKKDKILVMEEKRIQSKMLKEVVVKNDLESL